MIEGLSKVLTMTGEAHNSDTDDSHSVALNAKIDRAC